jgi:sugar phosphate isomerase/epimerase
MVQIDDRSSIKQVNRKQNRTMLFLSTVLRLSLSLSFVGVAMAQESRRLIPYSFGGLETKPVSRVVTLLKNELGYAGIAAKGYEMNRLKKYLNQVDFEVGAVFISHKFKAFGFDDSYQRAVIDLLAERQGYGTVWFWFEDNLDDGSVTKPKVKAFVKRIFRHAKKRNIRMVLYPHYGTIFETVDDTLPIVKQVNHPLFGTSISLNHERLAGKSNEDIQQAFVDANGHIFAVILSGQVNEIDYNNVVKSMNNPLDESEYDLQPFMGYIRNSTYAGPVYFINFQITDPPPELYLNSSMTKWDELCSQVGLFEPEQKLFTSCLEDSFVQCMPKEDCGIESSSNISFKKMLQACEAAEPISTYQCAQRALLGSRTICYDAPGYVVKPFCSIVFEGYRQGSINRSACNIAKQRCKTTPNDACGKKKKG